MKLTVYRQSGSPVNPTHQAAYLAEYQAYFDKCELRSKKVFAKNSRLLRHLPEMIIMQRMLQYGERLIMRMYGGQDQVELPRSAKAWTELLNRYSETPIMVAKERESGKLLLLLMDDLGQG